MLSNYPIRVQPGHQYITQAKSQADCKVLPDKDGIYNLSELNSIAAKFITSLPKNTYILLVRDANFKCWLLKISVPIQSNVLFQNTPKNIYTVISELNLPSGKVDIYIIDTCGNFDYEKFTVELPKQIRIDNSSVNKLQCTQGHIRYICYNPQKNELVISTDEPHEYSLLHKHVLGLRSVSCNLPSLPDRVDKIKLG